MSNRDLLARAITARYCNRPHPNELLLRAMLARGVAYWLAVESSERYQDRVEIQQVALDVYTATRERMRTDPAYAARMLAKYRGAE